MRPLTQFGPGGLSPNPAFPTRFLRLMIGGLPRDQIGFRIRPNCHNQLAVIFPEVGPLDLRMEVFVDDVTDHFSLDSYCLSLKSLGFKNLTPSHLIQESDGLAGPLPYLLGRRPGIAASGGRRAALWASLAALRRGGGS